MKKKHVLALLIVLNLAFIWGNSALSGETSGQISGGLLQFLRDIFGTFAWGEYLLRKLGHFSEFACLGALLYLFWQCCEQKGLHAFAMPLLCGLLAACCDETIQVFTPDRGPSVIDVWIDTFGVCTGIVFIFVCTVAHFAWKRHKAQKKEPTKT